jgi:2-haloacid dehalogenase
MLILVMSDSVTRPPAFAFDAYGTLFDVHSAIRRHAEAIGPEAEALSALWRQKQLEYSWTRTLMGRYADFWTLTQQALDHALARHPSVDPAVRPALLDAYWRLQAYPDVLPALTRLRQAGHVLSLFTNGTAAMAEAAANAAGALPFLDLVVSVDAAGRFKTHPETYALVCRTLARAPDAVTLVSSNRWDVAGAKAFGMGAIWVNRTGQPDEYPDLPPDRVIGGLEQL